MESKKKLQDRELENVSGGLYGGTTGTVCSNCKTIIKDFSECESKQIKSGCKNVTVYKCPGCGRWLYESGQDAE